MFILLQTIQHQLSSASCHQESFANTVISPRSARVRNPGNFSKGQCGAIVCGCSIVLVEYLAAHVQLSLNYSVILINHY